MSARRKSFPIWLVLAAGMLWLWLAEGSALAEVNFLAIGDWGAANGKDAVLQTTVEHAMQRYVTEHHLQLDAVFLLGDNFYQDLKPGDTAAMDKVFDQRYPASFYKVAPFYAVMGNHDCERVKDSHLDPDKIEAQLGYAKRPASRFQVPANADAPKHARTYYRVDFPGGASDPKPLVTLLGLDSNWHYLRPIQLAPKVLPNGKKEKWDAWKEENAWLAEQLAETKAKRRWVIAMAHFPIFTNGEHQDTAGHEDTDNRMTMLHWLGMWSDPAKELPAPDFYLCGHNHDLEHIETARPQTSFITSGGGGGEATYRLYNNLHGPFSRRLLGFVHLHFTADTAEVTIVGAPQPKELNKFKAEDFSIVHVFRRDLATGKVEIIAGPQPQIDPGKH